MMILRYYVYALLLGLVLVFGQCTKAKIILIRYEKEILDFIIPNTTTNVVFNDDTILIEVYPYVDVTKLTPIVVVSDGATVDPPSGSTVDFTEPVIYAVTALDGSVAEYTVTINKNLSRRNDIEDFRLVGTQQIFEREGDNIFIYVPYETDVTNIKTDIVVSDLATVSPESGEFMDFTNPQIYTVRASDGSEKDFLVTVKRSPWRKVANGPFAPRDEHTVLVFKDKMWLLGGWVGNCIGSPIPSYPDDCNTLTNDVWNTSNGKDWDCVSNEGENPWIGRHGSGVVVYKDSIWIISGDGHTDVWKSGDGVNWELVTDEAPWGQRYGPYVAVFNDKLWLIGGVDWWNRDGDYVRPQGTKAFNDVWSSINGKDWELELEFAPFAQRGMIHGYTVFNDELYILGGGTRANWPPYSVFNDVWKTSNAISWTRVTNNAAWLPRLHHNIIDYDSKLWIVGGTTNSANLNNDVWYSENGGISWKQLKHSFFPITHASSLCVFQGKLWMVSGFMHNQIWVLEDTGF